VRGRSLFFSLLTPVDAGTYVLFVIPQGAALEQERRGPTSRKLVPWSDGIPWTTESSGSRSRSRVSPRDFGDFLAAYGASAQSAFLPGDMVLDGFRPDRCDVAGAPI
jgi:hypothetical protein